LAKGAKLLCGSTAKNHAGKAGIAEFTDLRWITVQTAPQHYPFRGSLLRG